MDILTQAEQDLYRVKMQQYNVAFEIYRHKKKWERTNKLFNQFLFFIAYAALLNAAFYYFL